jgi:hypothetical protein
VSAPKKIAALLVVVLALIAPATAAADSPFDAALTGGSLKLGTLSPFALGADQIKVSGPLGDDGTVNIPASGITFQPISTNVDVSGFSLQVTIGLSATGPATGKIPLSGGPATLTVPAQASVEALPLLPASQGCTVGPITFAMSGTYDAATKKLSVAQPDVSVPAVGTSCGALGGVVNSQLGLPSTNNAVSLDFAVDALQGALSFGKLSAKLVKNALSVPVTCKGGGACDGVVQLTTKVKGKSVVLAKSTYSVAADKAKTLKLKPSASARKKIDAAGKKGLKSAVEIWPKGAKKAAVTKSLTVKGAGK